MFQFPGFASRLLGISCLQQEGLPHSDTCGCNGYLLLPAAFRSLSRPSSPLRTKASTVCPYLLSQVFFLLLISLFHHVKELFVRRSRVRRQIVAFFPSVTIGRPAFAKASTGNGGEYRSRTDDLLRARQAL